jgi:hypothetical protein
MILRQPVPNNGQIRCFGIVMHPKDRKYKQTCGHLLMKPNSEGDAAAQIKCPAKRCGAVYEIKDGYITLIRMEPLRSGKKQKESV